MSKQTSNSQVDTVKLTIRVDEVVLNSVKLYVQLVGTTEGQVRCEGVLTSLAHAVKLKYR